jgi:hypothetical protein
MENLLKISDSSLSLTIFYSLQILDSYQSLRTPFKGTVKYILRLGVSIKRLHLVTVILKNYLKFCQYS